MWKGLHEFKRFANPFLKTMAKIVAPVGHRRFDRLRRMAAGEHPYLGSSVGFTRSQQHQIMGPAMKGHPLRGWGWEHVTSLYSEYNKMNPGDDIVNLICFIEFYTKMGEVLLQRVDRITMLHSLEARAPFLDHDLIELAFSIPGEIKIKGNRLKGILKEFAARSLPPDIIDREKTGFSFPFNEWLRGELGTHVENAFKRSRLFEGGWANRDFCLTLLKDHRAGGRDNSVRLWMMFDLCRWYDRWMA
jgi:asparagine synthase (glutamine-hydrolysing)